MLLYTEGFYNILRFVTGEEGEDANSGHRVQKVQVTI